MNSFVKIGADWGVRLDVIGDHEPGDVVTITTRRGAAKRVTLGEYVRQDAYGHVFRIAAPERRAAELVGDLSRIVGMFDRAATRLRRPAITFDTYRVSVAGPRAREPGSLTVTGVERNVPSRFGGMTRQYFGKVTRAGMFQPSNDAPEGLGERLRAFAADPVAVATAHGLRGRCCFCNHPVGEGVDRRSVEIGYGPDCADNFGLPWGTRAARAQAPLACHPIAAVPAADTRQLSWVD